MTVVTERLHFEGQGHYVSLSFRESNMHSRPGSGAKRGRITSFSRKSRKRMLEKTARLSLDKYVQNKPVIFITLTYGQQFPAPLESKHHLQVLVKRFRRLSPDMSGMWRMEFQDRGAPHFHLILFNMDFLSKEALKVAWGEIIGLKYWDTSSDVPREPFSRIEAIRHARKVMAYVSKYVAKEDGSSSGFNDLPYLTASRNIGRVWGVINSKGLPWGELIAATVELPRQEALTVLWQYRRLMAKKWRYAAQSGRYKGASLFVDNVLGWHKALIWCLTEYCYDKWKLPHPRPNPTMRNRLC